MNSCLPTSPPSSHCWGPACPCPCPPRAPGVRNGGARGVGPVIPSSQSPGDGSEQGSGTGQTQLPKPRGCSEQRSGTGQTQLPKPRGCWEQGSCRASTCSSCTPQHHGAGVAAAPCAPADTQTYLCITPALALPHAGSENSDGLRGSVPCLLTPWQSVALGQDQPTGRVTWLVALSQACVSAGESKWYFSSAGVFQKPCKVPASTFALVQTCTP